MSLRSSNLPKPTPPVRRFLLTPRGEREARSRTNEIETSDQTDCNGIRDFLSGLSSGKDESRSSQVGCNRFLFVRERSCSPSSFASFGSRSKRPYSFLHKSYTSSGQKLSVGKGGPCLTHHNPKYERIRRCCFEHTEFVNSLRGMPLAKKQETCHLFALSITIFFLRTTNGKKKMVIDTFFEAKKAHSLRSFGVPTLNI